ncbi:protein-glucosylgalactosylhydroxylysine glucosidase-like [Clytia hemisphaerica]|uniref:Protein-glucosylgalactosylhydroxylysine glucosidase n=2 Tax=Clytia hemisphaerica TaxID=252671 RepID=A0A7M5WWI1_9CNID
MALLSMFYIVIALGLVPLTAGQHCSESFESTPTCIVTDSLPRTEKGELNFRSMPSVGNGYLGTVVMSDEVHVSGVFNGRANVIPDTPNDRLKGTKRHRSKLDSDWYYDHTHRARVPSTVAIEYRLKETNEQNQLYFLDTERGYFAQTIDTPSYTLHQKTYAHRLLKNILITEIETNVKTTDTLNFTVLSNIGNKSRDINFQSVSSNEEWTSWFGYINQTETETSQNVSVAVVFTNIPTFKLMDYGLRRDLYITAIATSLDSQDPIRAALSYYEQAKQLGDTMELFPSHVETWSKLWDEGNITIENDLYLSQTVFTSFYNILSSVREDWTLGLSPGSLPMGYEYLGHSFWDQDIWMFPPVMIFHPKIGRSLLEYRYQRLPAAMEIAKKYKFKGAMFPWESALSGFEVCPQEVYGRNEIHITGDIAFAINQYYSVTGDLDWIRNYGFPIIYQSAVFWESRVTFEKESGTYWINDVMPPDEYHYPVNNSVYTNVIAQINFRLAIKFADLLDIKIPSHWEDIAASIYIPFDEKLQYHPEYDGFDITDPKSVVKQADTILINFPLMYPMDKDTRKNDLFLYGKITDSNGPAMTHSMFSIGWNEIGEKQNADQAFQKNYENIQPPFHVWSEIRKGDGAANFITAAGGYLQSIIFGYAGLRLRDDGLHFDMQPLPGNKPYCLNGIKYRNDSLQFCWLRIGQCSVRNSSISDNEFLTRIFLKKNDSNCIGKIVNH